MDAVYFIPFLIFSSTRARSIEKLLEELLDLSPTPLLLSLLQTGLSIRMHRV